MPQPILDEPYGSDLPEINEFYRNFAAGLQLSIGGERESLDDLLDSLAQPKEALERASQGLSAARRGFERADLELNYLMALPMPRKGLVGIREARKIAEEALSRSSLQFDEARRSVAKVEREIALREGAKRKLTEWQNLASPVNAPFGVYALYDFDDIALYVGKTTEGLGKRIQRHLTNQRTDAVGMGVLDPLEVAEIEVWPLWPSHADAARASVYVSGLEYLVASQYEGQIFNEREIRPLTEGQPEILPASVRFDMFSPGTRIRLGHPDARIRRRAATLAKLSTRISERSLNDKNGLRLSMLRQLARLTEIAKARFDEFGGMRSVAPDENEED